MSCYTTDNVLDELLSARPIFTQSTAYRKLTNVGSPSQAMMKKVGKKGKAR